MPGLKSGISLPPPAEDGEKTLREKVLAATSEEVMAEATKFDDGKAPMDLLPPDALLAIAQVMAVGREKYEAHNWCQGMRWGRLVGALERHLAEFKNANDNDPETNLLHLAHLGCNAIFLLTYQLRGLGTDDRVGHALNQAVAKCE